MSEQQWMTPNQAAAYLGVTSRTLRNYVSQGRLRAYRLGTRNVRYSAEDISRLLTPIETGR